MRNPTWLWQQLETQHRCKPAGHGKRKHLSHSTHRCSLRRTPTEVLSEACCAGWRPHSFKRIAVVWRGSSSCINGRDHSVRAVQISKKRTDDSKSSCVESEPVPRYFPFQKLESIWKIITRRLFPFSVTSLINTWPLTSYRRNLQSRRVRQDPMGFKSLKVTVLGVRVTSGRFDLSARAVPRCDRSRGAQLRLDAQFARPDGDPSSEALLTNWTGRPRQSSRSNESPESLGQHDGRNILQVRQDTLVIVCCGDDARRMQKWWDWMSLQAQKTQIMNRVVGFFFKARIWKRTTRSLCSSDDSPWHFSIAAIFKAQISRWFYVHQQFLPVLSEFLSIFGEAIWLWELHCMFQSKKDFVVAVAARSVCKKQQRSSLPCFTSFSPELQTQTSLFPETLVSDTL